MGALGVALGVGLGARTRGPAVFDFAGGALPPGATLTRAGPAYRTTASGLLTAEPANAARFDHDPATLASLGLLIEGGATNACAQSQSFGAATWTRRGTLAAADNQAAAPDGTQTACLLTGIGGAGAGDLFETSFTANARFAAGAPLSASLFVRRVSTAGTLELASAVNAQLGRMQVNLAALPDGWTRIWAGHPAVTLVAPFAASGTGQNGLLLWCSSGAPASVLAWGAQLEAAAASTSYVPTAGASATRAADQLTLSWGVLGAPDGSITVRYVFDDGSTQDVGATVVNGTATVPTTLARARIRRAERVG